MESLNLISRCHDTLGQAFGVVVVINKSGHHNKRYSVVAI